MNSAETLLRYKLISYMTSFLGYRKFLSDYGCVMNGLILP
jgi:hypothetical protein